MRIREAKQYPFNREQPTGLQRVTTQRERKGENKLANERPASDNRPRNHQQ